VHLRNVPNDARIMLDGLLQSGDSFEVPNDGRARVIEVIAAGKQPWKKTHPSQGEATYDVWLVDGESTAKPTRKAATTSKKSTAKPATKRASPTPTHPTAAPKARRRKAPSAIRKLDF
jgi:hypothetical protein